ncbi:MAG: tRNA (N6-isopentenyl adenosine(37)-C2)-methylthiotransferase MiaB [Candidatus Omnitrophica bacterium]|nr:tRNA (N6-isopentenyl adenosine(37)-C2)-methylthiotransferase MiaB [Candidatus Omnitrophota bacterium]MBU4590831.1 tRNA (N6-isopentenyl adenosine(37)-C2)-methylthiotransferase MiaB [Candidatus Omnitrophota bacterium]
MNEHDSRRVEDLLLGQGYALTNDPEEADVLLFNTCSVRKHAEDRVFGKVGDLKKIKKQRPEVIFGILGCMAEAQKDLIFRKLPHVDFLCGPADLDRVPEILERIRGGSGHIICLEGYKSKRIPGFSEKRSAGDAAYVKIMEGCDNFCAYCIVPYVRGRERSRSSKEILSEVKGLVDKGVKRIMLLGQNVNSYGKGLKEKISFSELLRKIDSMIKRDCFGLRPRNDISSLAMTDVKIDFMTSHPKDAGMDLFKAIGELKSLSKQLHLPLQSGSNKVLKQMNRGYTIEKYKKLVKDFRKTVKNGIIMSDFIVGFPGETKKDFEDTLKAVKELQFGAAYIFKYSARPFTKASKFKDDVPQEEKERRHKVLLETQKKISKRLLRPPSADSQ